MTRPRLCPAAFFVAAVICLLGAACKGPSDEARIRAHLEDAASLAEERDVKRLSSLFAPDFADFQGRDKAGAVRLISDHLDRYRGVVIHVLGVRVGDIRGEGLADVECEVALSHGAAEVLRKLVPVGSEYYRFRFDLRKGGAGEWRFAFAEWESIGIADLFPESLGILKKIFPDF